MHRQHQRLALLRLCVVLTDPFACLNATAHRYLSELCTLVTDVASLRHLRSVCQKELIVPRHKLSSAGWRAFSISQPCRSGILWQIICVIRFLDLTVL